MLTSAQRLRLFQTFVCVLSAVLCKQRWSEYFIVQTDYYLHGLLFTKKFKNIYYDQAARHSMSADLYFTSVSSFFFFFRRLISEVAERNSTKIGHMVGSKCNLKTHVRNLGYPLPLQIGDPKTTFFGQLRNLTATLTAYIFGMKHDIDNLSSALTTTRCLLQCPKMS